MVGSTGEGGLAAFFVFYYSLAFSRETLHDPGGLWRRYTPKFVGLQGMTRENSLTWKELSKNWCPGSASS